MHRPLALLLLIAPSLLAGCTGSPDADEPGPGFVARDELEFIAELPEWRIGQGWRYVMDVPGHRTQTVTMIVAEERDDLWVVATTDPEQALHHALFSLSPILGRTGKETLSPFQAGSPVDMYHFPLMDGDTWDAPFFGESMRFEAHFTGDIALHASLGLGEFAEGFRVRAQGASGVQVSFDYVDAAQWFTHFEVSDEAGTRLIRFDLVGLVSDHKGPYHFYRGEDLLVETFHATSTEPTVLEIEVPTPAGFTDGMAIAVSYLGLPSTLPPIANITLRGPPGEAPLETVYLEREFTNLGHGFAALDLNVDPACLSPADAACAGDFLLALRLAGETRVEVRVVSYQVFAEGNL